MCEGIHGMNMRTKEGPRTYDILFEFAGDRYFVSIRSTGNIWKSLIDHDLNNRDRLCDLITYDNIISVNGEWSASEFIEGWDDILENNRKHWDFEDCAIEYVERNGYCWFELHPIVDGVERFHCILVDRNDLGEVLLKFKEVESPIGTMEDMYGIPIGSENAIQCSEDHKPMEYIRETRKHMEVIDRRYWPTEEDAIADAIACWKDIDEADREDIMVLAGIIDGSYPECGDIPIIVFTLPDD